MRTGEFGLLTEIPFGLRGRLVCSSMPFGPYDPLSEVWPAYQASDIQVVVVLAEPQEYLVHASRDLPAFYRSAGLDVILLPIADYAAPRDLDEFANGLIAVEEHLQAGRNVAVHCMAGIGRTGTFLACLAKQILEMDGRTAMDWVRQYIPGALESSLQEAYVLD